MKRLLFEIIVILTVVSCGKQPQEMNVNLIKNNALMQARCSDAVAITGYTVVPQSITVTHIDETSRYICGVITIKYYNIDNMSDTMIINYPIHIYVDKINNGSYIVIDKHQINKL